MLSLLLAGSSMMAFAQNDSDSTKKSDNLQLFGLYNQTGGDIRYPQLGALGNRVDGEFSSVQIGGVFNQVGKDVDGFQLAGFVNQNGGAFYGAQFSGLYNQVADSVNGFQATGLVNNVGGRLDGFQGAGLANLALDSARGVQASGIFNFNKGLNGAQMAGVFNQSEAVRGIQMAGVFNHATDLDGAQISGVCNLSRGTVDGFQLAGVLNIAKKLKGVQLGVINVVDTVESGAPIGIVNIVRRGGLHSFGLSANEVTQINAHFRLGTKAFFTSVLAGTGYANDRMVTTAGLGLGHIFTLSERSGLMLEGSCSYLFDDGWPFGQENGTTNLLNKLALSYNYNLGGNTTLYLGPVVNVHVWDATNEGYTPVAPYTFFDETSSQGLRVQGWVGGTAGIMF